MAVHHPDWETTSQRTKKIY